MSNSRLFGILYYLIENGGATAPELADQFEVSVRTIYRDVDALSAAGIPVYAEPGRKGGIRLLNGFVLDRTLLSASEKEDILTALQSRIAAGDMEAGLPATLTKLSALFRLDAPDWLEVDFSRWGDKPADNRTFNLIREAISRQRALRIRYAGSAREITERKIFPLKLAYKSRAWYVKAFCAERRDFRMFKLTRVLALEALNETFLPLTYPKESDMPEAPCDDIVLRFPTEMAYRVLDEFDPAEITVEENGALLVRARMPKGEWLATWLLTFVSRVEILSPPGLRDEVAALAKQIFDQHSR